MLLGSRCSSPTRAESRCAYPSTRSNIPDPITPAILVPYALDSGTRSRVEAQRSVMMLEFCGQGRLAGRSWLVEVSQDWRKLASCLGAGVEGSMWVSENMI